MRAVCAREAALLGESLVQLLSACFSGKKKVSASRRSVNRRCGQGGIRYVSHKAEVGATGSLVGWGRVGFS